MDVPSPTPRSYTALGVPAGAGGNPVRDPDKFEIPGLPTVAARGNDATRCRGSWPLEGLVTRMVSGVG